MGEMKYYRVGVPLDMVTDDMFDKEFDVQLEPFEIERTHVEYTIECGIHNAEMLRILRFINRHEKREAFFQALFLIMCAAWIIRLAYLMVVS